MPFQNQQENNELKLLKALQRSDVQAASALLLRGCIDFEALDRFLSCEHLSGNAYALIDDLNLQALFPKRYLQPLEEQLSKQARRNDALFDNLRIINQEFQRAGIDYLLLKGLHLAETYWQSVDRRFIWDLDVLVRPTDLSTACAILQKLGFRIPRNSRVWYPVFRRITHAIGCENRQGISIDLHWTFRKLPKARFDLEAVWQQRKPFHLSHLTFQVPSTEHLLLMILLGIADDIGRSKCRLRSLWDVYLLLQSHPEFQWSTFFERRKKEGLLRLIVNVLLIVLYRLDCGDEFPTLAQALSVHQSVHRVRDEAQADLLSGRSRRSLVNLRWFADLQPAPNWYYWLWWSTMFPLRVLLIKS